MSPSDIVFPLSPYLAFIGAAAVLVLSPGPVNVVVMAVTQSRGRALGLVAVAGASASIALQLMATLAGLDVLATISPTLLNALQLVGAGYIGWLGTLMWRAPVHPQGQDGTPNSAGLGGIAWLGFLVSSTNPKSVLVFPAFFSGFADAQTASVAWLLLLGVTFWVIFVGGLCLYVLFAQGVRRWGTTPDRQRWVNRTFGGSLCVMALGMAIPALPG